MTTTATRDIILYGDLPEAVYVLRIPANGVRWEKLMQAARRLVKRLTNTPNHKPAPRWNVEAPPEPRGAEVVAFNPTKFPIYQYDNERGEFLCEPSQAIAAPKRGI